MSREIAERNLQNLETDAKCPILLLPLAPLSPLYLEEADNFHQLLVVVLCFG